MTRFITLHQTPAVDGEAVRSILVNVAHIVMAKPASTQSAEYKSSITVGGDCSLVTLSDEFEDVQRLILGDAPASTDLEQVASLIRDALSGVELVTADNKNPIPTRMLRERLNAALALVGVENTMTPSASGEPVILDAADVGKLKVGDGVTVYDRQFKRETNGYVERRGTAPAGLILRLPHPDGGFGKPMLEPFDNTGRSVDTMPPAAWNSNPANAKPPARFYIVDDFSATLDTIAQKPAEPTRATGWQPEDDARG